MPMRVTLPDSVPHLDHVAHADRPLDDEDQAGDEVVDDVLQSEADAHA